MLNGLDYNTMINFGSFVALTIGTGVLLALAFGAQIKLVPAPITARRKR